jgi:NADH-quinone oxidoreductase subunit J
MNLETFAIIMGGLTIGSALMVIISKNPVKSVLFLVLTFFFISGNYILMNAQFIAAVNIIVYAGAIMVLFLFVLMLLNLSKENEPKNSVFVKFAALVAGGILFTVLIAALKDGLVIAAATVDQSDNIGLVENLGQILFTKYVLPFEISSVLFIAAMVGAVLTTNRLTMVLATIFQNGVSIDFYIVLSTILFVIGLVGVMIRRNAIILLMCIELMLNAVNLLMVAFSTYFGKSDGQIFVFFIMVVAAAEATVGLSILVMAYRNIRTTDVGIFNKLKG